MKKILTVVGVLMSSVVWGQLSFEHKYENGIGTIAHVENVEGEGHKYVYINKTSNSFDVYNLDHSLFKSVQLTHPGNPMGFNRYYLSKTLFNSDNKIEFLIAFSNSGTYSAYLMNEDGVTLQTFNNSTGGEVTRVGGSYKLLTSEYNAGTIHTNVWNLPGQYLGVTSEPREGFGETEIYPNPVETVATITYTLPNGQKQAPLRIYNTIGILVKQLTVTDQFKNVLIHSGDLPRGNYVYEVAGQIRQFVVN